MNVQERTNLIDALTRLLLALNQWNSQDTDALKVNVVSKLNELVLS